MLHRWSFDTQLVDPAQPYQHSWHWSGCQLWLRSRWITVGMCWPWSGHLKLNQADGAETQLHLPRYNRSASEPLSHVTAVYSWTESPQNARHISRPLLGQMPRKTSILQHNHTFIPSNKYQNYILKLFVWLPFDWSERCCITCTAVYFYCMTKISHLFLF